MNPFTGIGIAVAGVFGLTVLFGSWYTVDQGERVVVTRNGAVVDEAGPGLHFKTPWIESTTAFRVKTDVMPVGPLAGHTADLQQIEKISAVLNFHVDPDGVKELYSQLGSHYRENKVENTFEYEIGTQLGKVSAQELTANRDAVAKAIADELRKELLPYHIIVETVQLGTPGFNKTFEDNINQLVTQETAVRTKKQELEKEKVNADIARTTAQGTADARIITATAEAKAIQLQTDALKSSPEYVRMKIAEKWDGKLPTTMLPNAATPLIDVRATP